MKCRKYYANQETFRKYRNRSKNKYYSKSEEKACRSREIWTEEEKALVLAHECTDRELAEQLGRSVRAIQVQRHKLKVAMGEE